MKNYILSSIVFAAVFAAIPFSSLAKSVNSEPARSAQTVAAEQVGYYLELVSTTPGKSREFEIHEPGASFIKLHFSHFQLSAGTEVEVSNPSGTESYRYTADKKDARTFDPVKGDNGKNSFSAMSISGDTVIVRIHDNSARKSVGGSADRKQRVVIDSLMVGLSEPNIAAAGTESVETQSLKSNDIPGIQQACGAVDYEKVACYQNDDSYIFDRTRPVARMVTGSGQVCTAWRVGADNRVMAAKECLSGSTISSVELWFNYQSEHCFYTQPAPVTKVTGNSLLASSSTLDYILFTVNNFSSIEQFGYMGLDVREANVGEQIYIPHHSDSGPKLLSVQSDMNVGGLCQVDSANDGGGNEIGYFCDTWYGTSGAPVMAASSDRVIALNHLPLNGCYNTGVKMARIWPEISSYFGGQVPAGDLEDNNLLPEADLGWSCSQMQCDFNASGSSDPDGSVVGYHWDTGDGFTTSSMSFSHTFAVPGTYTITLTVEDNEGGTGTATSTVTAWSPDPNPNQPPSAAFSFDCDDTSCTFNASLSSDSDGSIESYQWDFGDGASQNTANVSVNHQYAQAGTYTVSLVVLDNDGASGSASSAITVLMTTTNVDPTADFSSSCAVDTCSFDAAESFDPDGSIVSYSWDFGDNQSMQVSTPSTSHTYSTAGDYNVILTVLDDAGGSDSISIIVNVTGDVTPPPNQAPNALFSFSCSNLSCSFNGSSSSDADGSIVSYQWSFGDGGNGAGVTQDHEFSAGGTYQVSLTVTDDDGDSDTTTAFVTVTPPPNEAPNANFSYNCSDLACNFNGTGSSDSDGNIISYSWTYGDGSTGSGNITNHTFAAPGTYQVRLTVTDNDGASDFYVRSVQVTVPEPEPDISLTASGSKYRGNKQVDLSWSGASTSHVRIIKDGAEIAVEANSGTYTDYAISKKTKSASYQVCESGGGNCSSVVNVRF